VGNGFVNDHHRVMVDGMIFAVFACIAHHSYAMQSYVSWVYRMTRRFMPNCATFRIVL
jgi:hypothetical protein